MSDASTIVRILPLSVLVKSIMRAAAEMGGRYPSRIIASPTQVQRWTDDAMSMSRDLRPEFLGDNLHVLGVRVVAGANDAQPELIWSRPITEES